MEWTEDLKMKKIIILLSLLTSGYALADGAFGTYKGMTKKDLEKKGIVLKAIDDNQYISKSAPISNKNFGMYKYSFKSNNRICIVTGFTEQIKSDRYGTEAKDKIDSIKEALKIKYGQPGFINDVGKSKDEDWLTTLENEPVTNIYTYLWNKDTGLNNKSDIELIILYPILFHNKTSIRLDYYFEECDEASLDGTGL